MERNTEAMVPRPGVFEPIKNLWWLSDGTIQLVLCPDGTVVWGGGATPDGAPLFASLLDSRRGGSLAWRPSVAKYGSSVANNPTSVEYFEETLVIERVWVTPDFKLRVTDALTKRRLVRLAECLQGRVDMTLTCDPCGFGLGDEPSGEIEVDLTGQTSLRTFHPQARLSTTLGTMDTAYGIGVATGRLHCGEQAAVSLEWGPSGASTLSTTQAWTFIDETVTASREWLRRGRFVDGPLGDHQRKAALALRGLTYRPTGAVLAAGTTSLPEELGGQRNWDDRVCRSQHGALGMKALVELGLLDEPRAFLDFLEPLVNHSGVVEVMYTADGGPVPPERILDELEGFAGSWPVRVGNGAAGQLQLDCPGWVLDLMRDYVVAGGELGQRHLDMARLLAEQVMGTWWRSDAGPWHMPGERRRHSGSRVMCWVALQRAAELLQSTDLDAATAYRAEAKLIVAELHRDGLNAEGCVMQALGSGLFDAAALLAVIFGFPLSDAQRRATVEGVLANLMHNGLLSRHNARITDGGVVGDEEGASVIATCWGIEALVSIGEVARAPELLDRLVDLAGPSGLYAENVDPATGGYLGNFPRAFSHLALSLAIGAVAAAEAAEAG